MLAASVFFASGSKEVTFFFGCCGGNPPKTTERNSFFRPAGGEKGARGRHRVSRVIEEPGSSIRRITAENLQHIRLSGQPFQCPGHMRVVAMAFDVDQKNVLAEHQL